LNVDQDGAFNYKEGRSDMFKIKDYKSIIDEEIATI